MRDSRLDIVEYNAPAGWTVADKPGAAVDGSQQKPFSVDLDLQRVGGGINVERIPLGVYHVVVSMVSDSGQTIPLSCSKDYDKNYGASAEIIWETPADSFARNLTKIYVRD